MPSKILLTALLACAGGCLPAWADFTGSASGSCTSGSACTAGAVSATATFSYDSADQLLSITLTNTTKIIDDAAQTLTAFYFTPAFSGAGSIASQPTSATSVKFENTGAGNYNGYSCDGNGQSVTCTQALVSSGTITTADVIASGANNGWSYGSASGVSPAPPSGSGFTKGLFAGNGSGKPYGIVDDCIVSTSVTANCGKSDPNSSLSNNHSPEILATTFVLKVTGDLTGLGDSAYFGYGTSSGTGFTTDLVTFTDTSVAPEPGYYVVLALGLVGLWWAIRGRKAAVSGDDLS